MPDNIPKGFKTSIPLSGAMPDFVIAALVQGETFETARTIRALLTDLAAVIVLREGPMGAQSAKQRIANMARVLTLAGDKHAAQMQQEFQKFKEETAATDGALPAVDALERVAEAGAVAKEWLDRIAKQAGRQIPDQPDETEN